MNEIDYARIRRVIADTRDHVRWADRRDDSNASRHLMIVLTRLLDCIELLVPSDDTATQEVE